MTVTFCGHGDKIYNEDTKEKLYNLLETLIKQGADKFLLGGYGNFDMLAAHTVHKLKEKYTYIESILVIPYLNREYYVQLYDETLYPPIEKAPKRLAIIKRNEWMVENSDILVCYVIYDWGGATKTLEYAKRKMRVKIFNIGDENCT